MHDRPKGRRTFLAGTIVLCLFAAAHSLAVIRANFGPVRPEDAPLRERSSRTPSRWDRS